MQKNIYKIIYKWVLHSVWCCLLFTKQKIHLIRVQSWYEIKYICHMFAEQNMNNIRQAKTPFLKPGSSRDQQWPGPGSIWRWVAECTMHRTLRKIWLVHWWSFRSPLCSEFSLCVVGPHRHWHCERHHKNTIGLPTWCSSQGPVH